MTSPPTPRRAVLRSVAGTTHSYSAATVAGDYVRATLGLGLVSLPLIFAETAPAVTALLASAAVLFLCYGVRIAGRQLSRFEVTEDGVSARGAVHAEIRWHDLRRLKLSYYSTRRDRSDGWLQLVLVGRGRRLRIDSRLQDFEALARRAVDAALSNRLRLDPATAFNIEALGLASDHRARDGAWEDRSE